jgi:hypothetical protein
LEIFKSLNIKDLSFKLENELTQVPEFGKGLAFYGVEAQKKP